MRTLLTTLFTAVTLSGALAQGIEFEHDWATALQRAKAEQKPMLIDFYTDNCFWCKQMDHRTFRDQTLNQTLMGNWIPLRINARKEPVLTDALKIRSFPTLVFAGPDGNILGFL